MHNAAIDPAVVFDRNPFVVSASDRAEAAAALRELGPKETHRRVMGALEEGSVAEAEGVLLAIGHAEALGEREPFAAVKERVWEALPQKRTAYLRIARAAARSTNALEQLVGRSEAMQRVRRETWAACFGESLRHALHLERVIVDHDVLILGETGTGKEALAQAIQAGLPAPDPGGLPNRAALNAAAIPETLVESELFGHVKGAFTGADQDRLGAIRKAHAGCLFLDEIGDLPRATQVKLLRVMETDEVRPLGSDETFPAECRYVAATHLDLELMVAEGDFRRDLYERLAGHVIRVPPLRDRREDIPELGRVFVSRYLGEDEVGVLADVREATEAWLDGARRADHPWPGNVRELQNRLRSVVLGLEPDLANRTPTTGAHPILPPAIAEGTAPLREVEDWYIARIVEAHEGSHSAAARVLGIDRGTVRRRLTP